MIFPTSLREALLACPPCSPWNLPSLTVESTLSFPCSRSDLPLTRQAGLSLTLTLSHLTTDCSVSFLFSKVGSDVLAYCSLCTTEASLSFSAGPVCLGFSAEACTILQVFSGLGSTNKSATSFLFLSDSSHLVFFSMFLLTSISLQI